MSAIMGSDDGYRTWQRDCGSEQQSLYTRFGDRNWDAIERKDRSSISLKVNQFLLNKQVDQCSEDEKKNVTESMSKLLELSGGSPRLEFGCTYVSYLSKGEGKTGVVPILRTRNSYSNKVFFYEHTSGRVYTGWADYEENNRLPKCYIAYPEDGFYKAICGRVALKYSESPACNGGALKIIDIVSGCAGAISSVCLAGALFFPPLALPAVAVTAGTALAASSCYGGGRTITKIIDRSDHYQSINPLDGGDPLVMWINMLASVGTLALGGAGVAANISSITSTNMTFMSTVLRYLSYGVNSFGIVISLVHVIIQWLKGELSSTDVDVFIALCVFVGNIVLTRRTATYVIQTIAEQPRRMSNFLNMVKNTTFATVKGIITGTGMGLERVLQFLTGSAGMQILRSIGLKRTIEVVKFVQTNLTKLRNGQLEAFQLLSEFYRQIFPYMNEFLFEIKEAVYSLEKIFCQTIEHIRVNGKRIFQRSCGMLALEVMDEVEGLIIDAQIHDPVEQEQVRSSAVNCAREFARLEGADCHSGKDFVAICEYVRDRISTSYDAACIVEQADGNLELLRDSKKTQIFKEVIRNFNMSQLVEEYRQNRGKSIQPAFTDNTAIFNKPLYETVGTSVYYFETPSNIDQFIYDAACELLKTDLNLDECTFHFRDSLIVIQYGNKSVIFEFEKHSTKKRTMIGLAIISEEGINTLLSTANS